MERILEPSEVWVVDFKIWRRGASLKHFVYDYKAKELMKHEHNTFSITNIVISIGHGSFSSTASFLLEIFAL